MLVAFSTLVLVLIFLGVVFRRNRKIHIPLMSAAFAIDLTLVLVIELNRHAIEQAITGVEGLLLFHIIVSTIVLLLYIALIVLGIRWVKNKPGAAIWHRRLAYVFIVGRLVNYVTSLYFAGGGNAGA